MMLVKTHFASFTHSLALESGLSLPEFTIAYEVYGQLNPEKTNAILLCHTLTGSHHAAGKPGCRCGELQGQDCSN